MHLFKAGLLTTLLLLVSNFGLASEVQTVHIFHTDANQVIIDRNLSYSVQLTIYNMDTKAKTDRRLNELVTARLKPGFEINLRESYGEAFNKVLNSPEWNGIYAGLGEYANAVEHAIKYKIEKHPAIMINGREIIYGVNSLREGLEIYKKKANKL